MLDIKNPRGSLQKRGTSLVLSKRRFNKLKARNKKLKRRFSKLELAFNFTKANFRKIVFVFVEICDSFCIFARYFKERK
ncbi:MAG: hypothetical protein HUK18_01210 [Bacteroidales bacterium]|nr:hypothetical protein [Bacteroidales bacterium]